MSTLAEIEQAVDQLPPDEFQKLAEHIAARAATLIRAAPQQERILGLHAGQGWVADNIMDPLPDETWEHNKE